MTREVERELVTRTKRLRANLAERVKFFRDKLGLTQKDAAASGGLNVRNWQKIEAGQHGVTLRTLVGLSLALGVEPADLLR